MHALQLQVSGAYPVRISSKGLRSLAEVDQDVRSMRRGSDVASAAWARSDATGPACDNLQCRSSQPGYARRQTRQESQRQAALNGGLSNGPGLHRRRHDGSRAKNRHSRRFERYQAQSQRDRTSASYRADDFVPSYGGVSDFVGQSGSAAERTGRCGYVRSGGTESAPGERSVVSRSAEHAVAERLTRSSAQDSPPPRTVPPSCHRLFPRPDLVVQAEGVRRRSLRGALTVKTMSRPPGTAASRA